jgi:hypothetical protein
VGETGLYLYAVARGLPEAALADRTGLRAAPLGQLYLDGLQAVTSEVDLDEFGEDGLRSNLEDLAWLEEVARTHDGVVHTVADHAPVVPMRLATVFLGGQTLRERLHEWSPGLHASLDRVEGRQEWSVKVLVDTAAAQREAEAVEDPPSDRPGSAYLLRRQRQLRAQEHVLDEAARTGDEVHAALVGSVVASRRLPAQDRRLSGYEGTMVLNAAYLVPAADAGPWRELVEQVGAQHPGATVQLDGPWPPYSFATLESPA